MLMHSPRTALLFGCLLLAAGCAQRGLLAGSRAREVSRVVTVNEQNANQLVQLHPGDKLVVNLPLQNGGQWQLLQSATPVLLTDYTPAKVSPYESHIFSGTTLSNAHPSGYVFIANAPGTELLQFATSGATRYTGIGNTYTLRVAVSASPTTAAR